MTLYPPGANRITEKHTKRLHKEMHIMELLAAVSIHTIRNVSSSDKVGIRIGIY